MKKLIFTLIFLLPFVFRIFSQTEVIVNGKFSQSNQAWLKDGDFNYGSTYSSCYSCPGYGYLSTASGNKGDNLFGSLLQEFTIPSNATSAILSLWFSCNSEEAAGTEFDKLEIIIENSNQQTLLGTIGAGGGQQPYSYFEYDIPSSYFGTDVLLTLFGTTDDYLPSIIRVDDVSLVYEEDLLPATPSGFNASAVSNSSINLSWNASSGATSYNIRTCSGTNVTNTNNTNYTVTGLNADTYYDYKVRAVNSSGNSAYSSCDGATTQSDGSVPPVPSGFVASAASSSSISLTWNSSSGATSYDIYTCSGNNVANTANTNFTVTGLNANTYYEYKVRAVNSFGNSVFGSCKGATTQSNGNTPLSPTGFTAVAASSSSISLSWNTSNGATNYEVYTCLGNVITTTSNTSYIVTGLNVNSFYEYKVRAVNSFGYSPFSPCQGAYTTIGTLTVSVNTPNGGETYIPGQTIQISANITGSISAKQIEYSIDEGSTWNLIWGMSTSNVSLNYQWLVPNTLSNKCRIKVSAKGGNGSWQTDVSNNNFAIQNNGTGQAFQLNPTLSHLFWPFPNSSWVDRDGWYGADEPNSTGGNAPGEGGHRAGEYYAVDWNKIGGDCNKEFYSPLKGKVLFINSDCPVSCGSSPTCQPNSYSCSAAGQSNPSGFGNLVLIQSAQNDSYVFRVCHLNSVAVQEGQVVEVGELLGVIGNTGVSYGSHPHCSLYKNIFSPFSNNESGFDRLVCGLSLGVGPNVPPYPNVFACPYKFDAMIDDGSGGGLSDPAPITYSGSTVLCNGSSIILTAPASASYYWSTGETSQSITVNSTGSYFVMLTNNQNVSSVSHPVDIVVLPDNIAYIDTYGSNSICEGLKKIIQANEGEVFAWSTGENTSSIEVSAPGVYSVTVTDVFGCISEKSVNLSMSSPPPKPLIIANGLSLAANSINGVKYHWSLNGVDIEGATSQFYTATEQGYYTVTAIHNVTGCFTTSDPVYLTVSAHEWISEEHISLSPNPSAGQVSLEIKEMHSGKIEIKIINSYGQTVFYGDETVNSEIFKKDFDLRFLPDGIYFVGVINNGHWSKNIKLVIQR